MVRIKISRRLKTFLILIFWVMMTAFIPAMAQAQQSDFTPWSGYWWPYRQGGLATGKDYRGHPAPLEKYQLLTSGVSSGDAVDWYLGNYYDPSAVSWAGLCPYWARASMMERYEIVPSSENNIVFRVGDKKGLLTLCHDKDAMKKVSGDDPVNLHLWLLGYINDQNIPFTADLDPGEEVWYFPIYRYDMTSQTTGSTQTVAVKVYYASDSVAPDYMGTLERLKNYSYTLTLNGNGEIIDGAWTGRSIDDHPDTLSFPESAAAKNPYIDCPEIRRIARARDDFLEPLDNRATTIYPGTYHLILLNQDQYLMDGTPGDEIFLEVIKDDSSDQDLAVQLTDAFNDPVMSQTLERSESMTYRLQIQNPPYTLTFSQTDYSDPNIYTLTADLLTPFQQNVPYIPKQGQWAGFTITNAGSQIVDNVMLVTGTRDGKPLQTVFGPLDINPGEKRVILFDDLPWRQHEYGDTESVCLIADQPIEFVNLFASDQKPMAGFFQGQANGTHLVIPDTYTELATIRQMTGGVLNESFVDAPVTFKVFAGDGQLQSQFLQTIPAGGRLAIQPGLNPFEHMPDGGWIDVAATAGIRLSAYQYVINKANKKDAIETLFALSVGEKTKFVPHITPLLGWWITYLTLINPSENPNEVNFHYLKAGNSKKEDVNVELGPYEKKVIDLSDDFGKLEGEALYRSVLEISGKYPIIGYYTYSPPYGGDEASYPLLDDSGFNNELILPHYAGRGGYFWTGICICNPNDEQVEVVMEPIDDLGQIIDTGVKKITLGPGAYDVFTVHNKFGMDASMISFIKIRSQDDPIGGFYMYGNMKNGVTGVEMLSGANM